MNEKILLKEYSTIEVNKDLLKEWDENPNKPITVIGILQRADSRNHNGRIYPYEVLKPEVDRYLTEVVRKGVGVGELDHTDTPIVEYKNASHIIDDIWWDGPEKKEVWGKIRLLDTPAGNIAKTIVKSGIPLGISSRAVGSVSKNESKGADMVGKDLQMICWDLVCHPSTHNSYLKIHESFNPYKNLPTANKVIEALRDILKK